MTELQFFTKIKASKKIVWNTLWQDKTFRDWAGIIDPGTYMIGDLKEGNEIQFISAENGFGVTSLVEKIIPSQLLVLRHHADTKEVSKKEREKQWTGGSETYSLTEKNGTTTLTVTFNVPKELEEYFKENYPKALERVRALAEGSKKI